MYFKSKKISLVILGITAIVCSRAMFWLFNDPKGPNLLIVIGMAVIIYFLSLLMYRFNISFTGLKRLLLVIVTQILIVAVFYFFLK